MTKVKLKSNGDWNKTFSYLTNVTSSNNDIQQIMSRYGDIGVQALREATPKRTGETADNWSYRVTKNKNGYSLEFINLNMTSNGTPIAILLQYGHGTRNGGYVTGRDFINPALRPVFDDIAIAIWNEVNPN